MGYVKKNDTVPLGSFHWTVGGALRDGDFSDHECLDRSWSERKFTKARLRLLVKRHSITSKTQVIEPTT